MSGVVKQRGTAPSAPSNKPPPNSAKMANSNGNSSEYGTLSYPSDVTDDVNMNEVDGLVTLDVTLPNGNKMDINIDYNTPMLDLLVSVAGKSRLNPSGLALQLISEDTGRPLAYKPNQTIGALGGRVVHIIKKPDGPGKSKSSKKKQPFEMTHRFTINLPRGQKAVSRVSPITSLGEMLTSVCKDKGLDPHKHVLQLPGQHGVAVDLAATVGQVGVFEMNLVNLALQDRRNHALSMPDLSQVPARDDKIPTYMPTSGETKKKRGFFSFLTRKEKKFKLNDTMYNMETSSTTSHMMSSAQSRKLPYQPHVRRGSDTGLENARPKSMFVGTPVSMEIDDSKAPPQKENVQTQVAAPARKKRRAPAPPVPENIPNKTQSDQQVPSGENSAPNQEQVQNGELHKEPVSDQVSPSNQKDVNSSSSSTSQSSSRAEMLSRLHSRNSSDSSGYHELTLSGCESPEATHGVIKSKISIDSTSIESADNANGDSGIHESPIRVSPIEEVLERGDSVAVVASTQPAEPLYHTLPSKKKKKKAPAPPPLSTPQPESSHVISVPEEANIEVEEVSIPEPPDVQMSTDVIDSTHMPAATMNLNEDEEISAEDPEMNEDTGFDINDILSNVNFDEEAAPFKPIVMESNVDENGAGYDSMMMVETASVASENIDQIDTLSKSERPCAFIPPPPPTEPPPPDEPEIDYDSLNESSKPVFVDKGTGVNEDNASLAPASAKTSPDIAHHRRMDSFSSVGSVDTIEGISLDFQMAIKMGQETLSPSVDDVEVSSGGFKSEMALFVERMSKMAVENPHGESNHLNDSLSSSLSAPGSDSTNSDTGSVIRHLRTDSHDSKSGSDMGSPRNKDSKSEQGYLPSIDNRKEIQIHTNLAVSEEISIPVETVPPPPEFGDDGEERDDESDDEEIVETVEEIIIPLGPNGYDFTSAKTVSETTTTVKSKENDREEKPADYGVFRAEPVSINPVTEPFSRSSVPKPIPISQVEKHAYRTPLDEPASNRYNTEPVSFTPAYVNNVQPQQSVPAEKEEFVLTTEDLSSVTFLPPKLRVAVPSTKIPESENQSTTLIMAKSNQKPYLNTFNEDESKSDSHTQNIQSRVSELSFTPRPESEADSLLEEKPIALLNMSSMKIAVERESSSNSPSIDDRNSIQSYSPINSDNVSDTNFSYRCSSDTSDQDYTDSSVHISQSAPDAVESSKERSESRASATSFDLVDQQEALQSQYNSLQAQFGQWQEQLQLNQNMLSTDNSGDVQPEQLQQLASQMTMQQDMMMQLQSTMQALQQQQQMNGRNEHKASSIEVEQAAAAAESAFRPLTPPPPPAPPAAPSIGAGGIIKSQVQLKPVKASKPKSNSKFERQLDPREELMFAIRGFHGREQLRSVPAKETKWIHSNTISRNNNL